MKIKALTDKEQIEFVNIYASKDRQAIKKFTPLRLIKYMNFLRHYTIVISDGTAKSREHSNDEINQSLFALFMSK